jgi:hypothetical protein
MKDIKGFCKLMDLSIPEYTHFDYYIEQFSKVEKWKNLKDLILLYEDAEEKCGDIFEYKIKKSNEVIEYLKNTRAFNELTDDNLLPDLMTTKSFEYDENRYYLSVDIKKANWYVLKKYDPEFLNELGDSYEDFMNKFNIHEIFHHSKQFRQFIFGNINPKRQGKAQRLVVQSVLDKYKNLDLEVACIKNDEIIYVFDDFSQITEVLDTIDKNIFKTKIFKVSRVEDFRINSYLTSEGNLLHKELVGCNGNRYFICLKKYIFNEPLDVRDLLFKMDGNLAIWFTEDLKVSL